MTVPFERDAVDLAPVKAAAQMRGRELGGLLERLRAERAEGWRDRPDVLGPSMSDWPNRLGDLSDMTDLGAPADGTLIVRSGGGWVALPPGATGQVLLIRSDGTMKYTDPPEVNVKAWGAKFDGVSDDSKAIDDAIRAVGLYGKVKLPAGTAVLNNAAYHALYFPRNAVGVVVEGAGKRATTLKLSANTPRLFDFSAQQVASVPVTGDLDATTTTVSNVTGTQTGMQNGQLVTHPSLPLGTTLLSGAGTATWVLSAKPSATATGQTLYCADLFTNVALKGFTVDCNNVQSRDAVILGNREGGTDRYYVATRGLTFEDLRTTNVPSVVTTGDYTQAASQRSNVRLTCMHSNVGEPFRGITVGNKAYRCEFYGGDVGFCAMGGGGQPIQTGTTNQLTGFTVTPSAGAGLGTGSWFYRLVAYDTNGFPCRPSAEASGLATASNGQMAAAWTIPGGASISKIRIYRGQYPSWYTDYQELSAVAVSFTDVGTGWTPGAIPFSINTFVDDNWAVECYHTPDPADRSVPTQVASGAGFQFVSAGYGGRNGMIRCRVRGCVDAPFELDAGEGLIEDCVSQDCFQEPIYINSASWPAEPATITIKGHRTLITDASTPRAVAGIKVVSVGGAPIGRIRIENYRHKSLNPSLACTGVLVTSTDTPLIELEDVIVDAPAISLAANDTNNRAFVFGANSSGASSVVSRIVMRGIRGKVGGKTNGFTATGTAFIGLSGGTYLLDWDDVRPDYNLIGVTAHSITGLALGLATNQINEGVIRGYRPVINGDTGGFAFTLTNSAIVSRLTFLDSSFTEIAGSSSSFAASSGMVPAALVGRVFAGRGFVPQGGWPKAPYAITPPASATYLRHAEGVSGRLVFSGGTGTDVKWSPDNGSFYEHWNQASGAFSSVPELWVEPGDYWTWIGTVAPTVTFIPSRA